MWTMRCLVLALLVGCVGTESNGEPQTQGDFGRVQFQYASGNGFSVGGDYHAGLDRAMMVGTTEQISVGGGWHRLPALTATTETSDIVAVVDQRVQCMCDGTILETCTAATVCPSSELYRHYDFTVEARGSGTTELTLRDASGELFDRTTVSAGEAARLELEQLFRTDDYGSVEARVVTTVNIDLYGTSGNNGGFGAEAPVWLRVRDASGDYLVASSGVDTVVGDDSVVTASVLVGHPSASSVELVPHKQGQTTLVMSVPRQSANRMALQVPVYVH